MIKLYNVNDSVNPKEIGRNPQIRIRPTTKGWQYWGAKSIVSIPRKGICPFLPEFPDFGLEHGAKYTDLMSELLTAAKCLVISERLYSLLAEGLSDAHQCFAVDIHGLDEVRTYYYLYMPFSRDEEMIDWPKCQFFDLNDESKTKFSVSDSSALRTTARQGKAIKAYKVVLKEDRPEFDFFRCRHFPPNTSKRYFVSQRLKESLESAGVTGIRFEKFECWEQGDL